MRLSPLLSALTLIMLLAPIGSVAGANADSPASVIIDETPGRQITFNPATALGAAIDGVRAGQNDRLLTARNIAAMRAAGLRSLTYRLRTELGIQTWHWNPAGSWSDAAHRQGYWTSSDRLGSPIRLSWGYRLPRRGDTIDQANNDDYSRLTDGDEATFWKSNPYLDPGHLHDGQPHWQWLTIRLDAPEAIDTVRIAWADPYAVRYEVQYWTSSNEDATDGRWAAFPLGHVEDGRGGVSTLRLANQPIVARFVRVLLELGSHTAKPGSTDWRDSAGFAVREVSLGRMAAGGQFVDLVRHMPSHDLQTATHVSSTDPWHRAVDRDKNIEQPGLDRIFASGLGNGQPILIPVGLLYDTPGNAEAELRYLRRRGYPVQQVELGEEPDGQYGEAEDYGALYLALIDRLKPQNPGIAFGGPSSQDALTGTAMNPDPDRSWNSHFIRYLKSRGRLGDLGFYSFEHYPFDDICTGIHEKLIAQDHNMSTLMARLDAEGVPRDIPWLISEYGFSAFSGRAMSEMPSALLMANIVGQFLSEGGSAAYMYGYGPDTPFNELRPCAGFGAMSLYMADRTGQATQPMPSFYTARLITDGWLMPNGRQHELLPSEVTGIPGEWVKSYAVRRPDHRIGLLIINRDPTASFAVHVLSRDREGKVARMRGPMEIIQYGPAQYIWQDSGPESHPVRDDPPARSQLVGDDPTVMLPPESLTVVVQSLAEINRTSAHR